MFSAKEEEITDSNVSIDTHKSTAVQIQRKIPEPLTSNFLHQIFNNYIRCQYIIFILIELLCRIPSPSILSSTDTP